MSGFAHFYSFRMSKNDRNYSSSGYRRIVNAVDVLWLLIHVGLRGLGYMMVSMFSKWYIVPGWVEGFNEKSVIVAILVVGCCVLSSFLTCRKIIHIKPAEALRPAPPRSGKKCIIRSENYFII